MSTQFNFGNPENPFNEPGVDNLRMGFDLERRPAQEVIKYMAAFPEEVTVEQLGSGQFFCTTTFDCTAPFDPNERFFLNDYSLIAGFELRPTRTRVGVTLGSVVMDGSVQRVWLRLRMPDEQLFGMPGVRDINDPETPNTWQALTMTLQPDTAGICAEVWGETITEAGDPVSHRLISPSERSFWGFYHSMVRGTMFTRERRQEPPLTYELSETNA